MWILKAKIPAHQRQLIASKTELYSITLLGTPVAHEIISGKLLVTSVGYLIGEKKDKQAFIKAFSKDKRVLHIEIKNDVAVAQFEQDIRMRVIYNPNIFFVGPAVANNKGENYFELASWEKKYLQEVAKLFLTKEYSGKILSFRKQKISNVFSLRALPDLTEKQKAAFELAVNNGYYEYPRKIDVINLAKLMKCSYTNYHFHLRQAEKKLMPKFLS
jgi:predicted DNA binding protein